MKHIDLSFVIKLQIIDNYLARCRHDSELHSRHYVSLRSTIDSVLSQSFGRAKNDESRV